MLCSTVDTNSRTRKLSVCFLTMTADFLSPKAVIFFFVEPQLQYVQVTIAVFCPVQLYRSSWCVPMSLCVALYSVCVCVCACVRACVRACVHVSVCK